MKHIKVNQLLDKFKHKDTVELSDFVQIMHDEFKVNVWIEEPQDEGVDIHSLAGDADLIRQVGQSREDRKLGRVFDQEAGLEYLHGKVEDFERGQNV